MLARIVIASAATFLALILLRGWFDVAAINAAFRNPASVGDQRIARQVLEEITKNTRFQHDWSVNGSLFAGGLTVHLFRSNSEDDPDLRLFKGNCAYSGHRATIICDVAIIDTMYSRWGEFWPPDARQEDIEASRQRFRKHMMTWLLAHELGHISAGHSASGFAHGPLDAYVKDASIHERNELIADEFVVDRLGSISDLSETHHWLIGILNTEIIISMCPDYLRTRKCEAIGQSVGILVPRSGMRSALRLCAGRSHPDFLIRAIRILKLSEDRNNQQIFGELIDSIYNSDFQTKEPAQCK